MTITDDQAAALFMVAVFAFVVIALILTLALYYEAGRQAARDHESRAYLPPDLFDRLADAPIAIVHEALDARDRGYNAVLNEMYAYLDTPQR